jgi:hypothetical protein
LVIRVNARLDLDVTVHAGVYGKVQFSPPGLVVVVVLHDTTPSQYL